jgi:hypothetical protein
MKKYIPVLLLFLLCAGTIHAQTPPAGTAHLATISWAAPSPVGGSGTVSGYNVHKSVAGAAFVKINSATSTTLSYVDAAVAAGQNLSYCVTTVDSKNQESVCSVAVSTTIPTNPNPPTVTITSVALTITGATETVLAKWNDTNLGVGEYFAFLDGMKFLGQGLTSSQTGSFAETLTLPAGTQVTFLVCNATGSCQSQKAM